MNVLLTGATGFVGSQLAAHVDDVPWHISALVRDAQSAQQSAWQGRATFHYGLLPDPDLSAVLCQGQDAIIHLAGLAHVSSGEAELRRSNLDATVQLATCAKAQGVRRFVFISSSKARFPAHSAYGRFKAQAEQHLLALHDASFDVVILRPGLVYGPGMRGNLAGLLRLLACRTLPLFVRSKNGIGMIGINDLCRAIVCSLTAPAVAGRIWELADEEAYTLDAIVAHVRALHAYRMPAAYIPRPAIKAMAGIATLVSPVLKSSFSMSTYRTLFDEHYCHNQDFWQCTGIRPAETLYQMLPALLKGVGK